MHNMDKEARTAARRRHGYIVSFADDDHFEPLCLIRTYGDIDCVAIYYSGEYAKKIQQYPERVKITNAEGDRFIVSAVAICSDMPHDYAVMIAIEKEGLQI